MPFFTADSQDLATGAVPLGAIQASPQISAEMSAKPITRSKINEKIRVSGGLQMGFLTDRHRSF
jgi:hypothetical protein